MELSAKTIRFPVLVQECGRPELVTLWQGAKGNKEFQKALADHRVMTIKQEPVGTKKDVGIIGFVETKSASLDTCFRLFLKVIFIILLYTKNLFLVMSVDFGGEYEIIFGKPAY